ncbi:MAG: hypothetical protein Q9212_002643 [Teloschistes hypoglaucus]
MLHAKWCNEQAGKKAEELKKKMDEKTRLVEERHDGKVHTFSRETMEADMGPGPRRDLLFSCHLVEAQSPQTLVLLLRRRRKLGLTLQQKNPRRSRRPRFPPTTTPTQTSTPPENRLRHPSKPTPTIPLAACRSRIFLAGGAAARFTSPSLITAPPSPLPAPTAPPGPVTRTALPRRDTTAAKRSRPQRMDGTPTRHGRGIFDDTSSPFRDTSPNSTNDISPTVDTSSTDDPSPQQHQHNTTCIRAKSLPRAETPDIFERACSADPRSAEETKTRFSERVIARDLNEFVLVSLFQNHADADHNAYSYSSEATA